MTTILEMQVRLYWSPEQLAAGTPEWTGSLDEFWEANQYLHTWREIRALSAELESAGFHRGGGGASPDFWLVRGNADVPKAPDGRA